MQVLDNRPLPPDIRQIVGRCQECGQDRDWLLQFAGATRVCLFCLHDALALLADRLPD